jgi:uncharacterized protein YdaU (DUF1376 family)
MRFTGLWWWIDRWRKSTAYMDMTLEAQAAYRNLLDEAALRGGPLPKDDRVLAKACGDATAWPRVRGVVMARFTLTTDGWHNETLDSILRESERRALKQQAYYRRVHGNNAGNTAGNNAGNKARNNRQYPDPDPDPDLKRLATSSNAGGKSRAKPPPVSPRRKRRDVPGGTACPHDPQCRSSRACIARTVADAAS